MRSPFPGMDPYIEAFGLWEDFHSDFIAEIKRTLAGLVPQRYAVRTGERAYVAIGAGPDGDPYELIPDVALTASHRPDGAGSTVALTSESEGDPEAAPVLMEAVVESEYRELFLEIHQIEPKRRLVTAIEVLSPSNKRPGTKGWRLYHRKRQDCLGGSVNFVELDLLRRGRRMPMASRWPESPYYLLVSRRRQTRCTVWPAHFRRPLPGLCVPLAAPDPDIMLALQPLVDAVYARSRYDRDIDYRRPLRPPLGPSDTTWLEAQLAERHKPV